jgi:hypothetical protein
MRVETVSQASNVDFNPQMDGIAQETRLEILIVRV